jgi:hypothetical protein
MWARYWVTTTKQTSKQHPLLGNRFLISKYASPFLSNAFANKQVTMATIEERLETVFSMRSVPRSYITRTIRLRLSSSHLKGKLEAKTRRLVCDGLQPCS